MSLWYLLVMSGSFTALRNRLVDRVVEGEGVTPATLRRAARANAGLDGATQRLVERVVQRPVEVTDDDLAAARAEGRSEDAVFELVVCAALGEAERQLDAALRLVEGVAAETRS